jgi:tetratricopeptide (TPR) repeat protein/transcriptional regulator with XRE-family HTH domain
MSERSADQEAAGLWLRRGRKAAGLTQEELAERSGLSVRTIAELERGRTRKPYPRSVRQLTDALGLSETASDELITWYRLGRGAASGLARELDQGGQPDVPPTSPGAKRDREGSAAAWLPQQLPPAIGHFVGRRPELEALGRLLERAEGTAGIVPIGVIGGTAGVGKTALALHWSHQEAGQFPDGQLYVDLRGYDPDMPMAATDVLAAFLRALGVPGHEIPADQDERAARYRTLLAGRRMLVVLDNASNAEQVRLLLPANPGCAVLVTSRDSLADLVARHGAVRLDLDLLSRGDASVLLRALIGVRVAADLPTAEALADQCARLPLDLLDAGGDPRTAVRAVFSWSYRHLDADAAHAFRLLGLHPGPDFDPYTIAALTGTSVATAAGLLNRLSRAYLVQPVCSSRYEMHDLLRDYATELAVRHETASDQRSALTRLFDHYLYTAAAAMDTLNPAEQHRRPRIRPPATPSPAVIEPSPARAWLAVHHATLTAVTVYTAAHGWPHVTTRLAGTLYRYLDAGHPAEAVTVHTHARRAARQIGDRTAEASALTNLGGANCDQGRYLEAADDHQQALAIYRQTGDRIGQARALTNLGNVDWRRGRYQQAASHHQQALALCSEVGDRIGQARALTNLAVVDERLGRYRQAISHLERSLPLCREAGDHFGEANTLTGLGSVHRRLGLSLVAERYLQQALVLFCDAGDQAGEAEALTELGVVDERLGRFQQAVDHHQQSLELCHELGKLIGAAEARNGLGEALLAIGRHDRACAQHTTALLLASQIGDQYEQARARHGLARSRHAVGDLAEGRHHWQEALMHYTELGLPETALANAWRPPVVGAAPGWQQVSPASFPPAEPPAESKISAQLGSTRRRAAP